MIMFILAVKFAGSSHSTENIRAFSHETLRLDSGNVLGKKKLKNDLEKDVVVNKLHFFSTINNTCLESELEKAALIVLKKYHSVNKSFDLFYDDAQYCSLEWSILQKYTICNAEKITFLQEFSDSLLTDIVFSFGKAEGIKILKKNLQNVNINSTIAINYNGVDLDGEFMKSLDFYDDLIFYNVPDNITLLINKDNTFQIESVYKPVVVTEIFSSGSMHVKATSEEFNPVDDLNSVRLVAKTVYFSGFNESMNLSTKFVINARRVVSGYKSINMSFVTIDRDIGSIKLPYDWISGVASGDVYQNKFPGVNPRAFFTFTGHNPDVVTLHSDRILLNDFYIDLEERDARLEINSPVTIKFNDTLGDNVVYKLHISVTSKSGSVAFHDSLKNMNGNMIMIDSDSIFNFDTVIRKAILCRKVKMFSIIRASLVGGAFVFTIAAMIYSLMSKIINEDVSRVTKDRRGVRFPLLFLNFLCDYFPVLFPKKMDDKSFYLTSAEFTFDHQLYNESIDFMNKYIDIEPKLDDDTQDLFIAPYRELIDMYRFSFKHICELILSNDEKDIDKTEKKNLDRLRVNLIDKVIEISQLVFDKIDKKLFNSADDTDKPKLKLFYADFKRYIAELDIEQSEEATEQSRKSYNEAIELSEKYLHPGHPVKLNAVFNLGILLSDVCDMTEESLGLLSKCVESVKPEIEKLESEDDRLCSAELIRKMEDLL